VVVLTDFDIPGIPPPLEELLLLKLVKPPLALPIPISLKNGSLPNIDPPKPNPPNPPKPPPPAFLPPLFPKKLLKKGSSSNS
jgi:hypothetical protein